LPPFYLIQPFAKPTVKRVSPIQNLRNSQKKYHYKSSGINYNNW